MRHRPVDGTGVQVLHADRLRHIKEYEHYGHDMTDDGRKSMK